MTYSYDRRLSKETLAWLRTWTWDWSKGSPVPSPKVIRELAPYRPKHPVKLYRFESDPAQAKNKAMRSFTYERGMVEFMAETDEQEGGRGVVIEMRVDPKFILVDMTLLPPGLQPEVLNEVVVSRTPI